MGIDRDPLLRLAAELDERDRALGAELAQVDELLELVDDVRARAVETASFLEALPAERATLDAATAGARGRREDAVAELERAEQHVRDLGSRRRGGEERLARATSERDRAAERVADLDARLAQVAADREALDEAERERRREASELVGAASGLAGRIRELQRVSDAGRGAPGSELDAVVDWGRAAHAGLFVVRAGLALERERVVREASELGAVVLGEPVGGAGVAAVRERIERSLRA